MKRRAGVLLPPGFLFESLNRHGDDKSLAVRCDISPSHQRIGELEEKTGHAHLKLRRGSNVYGHDFPVTREEEEFLSILPPRVTARAALQVCDLHSGASWSGRFVGVEWPDIDLHRPNIGFI